MKQLTTKEIRDIWIKFFETKGHILAEAKSLIPVNDHSLLWINSGVATLKDYFSGKKTPPGPRIVNCQRAIRTNDIENVGVTSRHHTFFEMLGNFSIGDYFKKEAIEFAFEFLTKELEVSKERLYITVFIDDIDAYESWINIGIDASHIVRCGRDRNFWDLGQGPCGPCTEIYYDRGVDYDPQGLGEQLFKNDIENDRYVEIWNIVFSQFNNDGKNNYEELARKNIDTGAGLERLACISQNVRTNYDIDTFLSAYEALNQVATKKYVKMSAIEANHNPQQKEINKHFAIIVDHTKTNVFAIADGAIPSGKERGYVLRKLIRRAMVSAEKIGIQSNFFPNVVTSIIGVVSQYQPYKELLEGNKAKIIEILGQEEVQFRKTMKVGLELFQKSVDNAAKNNGVMKGDEVFALVETYGFPYDIIAEEAQKANIKIDKDEYDRCFRKHQEISKGNKIETKGMAKQNINLIDFKLSSEFLYDTNHLNPAIVIAIFDEAFNPIPHGTGRSWIVFHKTPMYATSGGQSCDVGTLVIRGKEYFVEKVFKGPNHQHFHLVEDASGIEVSSLATINIDVERRMACTRNHSAEHLLHKALTLAIDPNIKQEGASKTSEKLTFDFQTYIKPSDDQIQKVEDVVNEFVNKKEPVDVLLCTLDEAKEKGAFAYFEDVYSKINTKLRVVKMGDSSIELCGGTHVKNLADIEQFMIVKCYPKGSGAYRIEAITGYDNIKSYIKTQNEQMMQRIDVMRSQLAVLEKNQEIANAINGLKFDGTPSVYKETSRQLQKIELQFGEALKVYELDKKSKTAEKIKNLYLQNNKSKIIRYQVFTDEDPKALLNALTSLSNEVQDALFIALNVTEKKIQYVAIKNSRSAITLNANDIILKLNGLSSGFGNGRPEFAQGGTTKIETLNALEEYVRGLK